MKLMMVINRMCILFLIVFPSISYAQYVYELKALPVYRSYSSWVNNDWLFEECSEKSLSIRSYTGLPSDNIDSVIIFYCSKHVCRNNLFDTSEMKFVRSMDDTIKYKFAVKAIITNPENGDVMWVFSRKLIAINYRLYEMNGNVLNFLGKNLPITLRDNWEIFFNYIENEYYTLPKSVPIERSLKRK